jgi:CheY-like chemotaxis protein
LNSRRPSVLIAEDDQATRDYLASALRLGGFEVQVVADGLAALGHIHIARPDAILLDLDLPLMNGFDVHAALQADETTRQIPIVIVTGTGLNSPTPVAATLTKPILPDDLIKVMFDALDRARVATADAGRVILWLCPACGRVIRETTEAGHPMTSEMRRDTAPCDACASAPR